MGCYDVFCPLCGGPLNGVSDIYEDFTKKFIKDTQWLSKITILLKNKVITNMQEINCAATFAKGKVIIDFMIEDGFEKGIPLHNDCWKFAKKEGLSYNNFINREIKDLYKKFAIRGLNYNPINKCWGQIFEVDNCEEYLLLSPLKSIKNKDRILKNIKNLKI